MVKKSFSGSSSRFDTIPACDRLTNGQTPYDGKDRAIQSVARVKTLKIGQYLKEWGKFCKTRFSSVRFSSVHNAGINVLSVFEYF